MKGLSDLFCQWLVSTEGVQKLQLNAGSQEELLLVLSVNIR